MNQEKELQKILSSDKWTATFLSRCGLPENLIQSIFSTHKRKFAYKPKGYTDPDLISRQLCVNTFTVRESLREDLVSQAKASVIYQFLSQPITPWYFVAKDLAEDLDLTDPPEEIPANFLLPDLGLIVFPKGMFQTTTGSLDFVGYKLFQPGEEPYVEVVCQYGIKPSFIEFTGETGYRLCWFSPERAGYLYGGIVGLLPSEFGLKLDNNVTIFQENASVEEKETNRVTTFLINLLIYSSRPEVQPEEKTATRARGFGQQSATRLTPLFIGKKYQKVKYISSHNQGKSHKHKPHYRRGHWRQQACGENWSRREWRLIQPTLVGVARSS